VTNNVFWKFYHVFFTGGCANGSINIYRKKKAFELEPTDGLTKSYFQTSLFLQPCDRSGFERFECR
jgi:hypothetical protein